jgi:hypothetical protein
MIGFVRHFWCAHRARGMANVRFRFGPRIFLPLLIALLSLSNTPPVSAASFSAAAEIVPPSVLDNGDTWLASTIDSTGHPYFAWRSGFNDATISNRKIRIAKRTGTTWAIVAELGANQIATGGMGSPGNAMNFIGPWFYGTSIAVDPAGAIHIAFMFQNDSDSCCQGTSQRRGLGYAKFSGGSWTTIEGLQFFQTSNGFQDAGNPVMRVTSTGVPAVAYMFSDAGPHTVTVRYASRAGGTWAITDIEGGFSTSNANQMAPAMAMDSNDHVHIVYNQGGATNSNLVERNDVSGSLPGTANVVVAGGAFSAPQLPSVAADSSNHLSVAYWDNTSHKIMFTSNAGGSFSAPIIIDNTASTLGAVGLSPDSVSVGGTTTLISYIVTGGY